jgi:hypothetical protein
MEVEKRLMMRTFLLQPRQRRESSRILGVYLSRRQEEGHEQSQVLCMSQVWALCKSMYEQEEGWKQTQPEVVASTRAQVDELAKKFEHT